MNISVKTARGPAKNRSHKKNSSATSRGRVRSVGGLTSVSTGIPRNKKGKKQAPRGKLPDNTTKGYFRTLVDPWEADGVKLGWGCMCPSTNTRAYLRFDATAASDGTLGLIAFPDVDNMIIVKNGGLTSPSQTTFAATDNSAIKANFGAGRIVSMGVKAFPSIAATSAPGTAYAGAIEHTTFALISAMTPGDLVSFPQTHTEIGSKGISATGRPQDVRSFEFIPDIVNGTGVQDTVPFQLPYVAFSGLPPGAIVSFVVCMNLEVTYLSKHLSAAISGGWWGDNLANHWSSFEQLWSNVQHLLPDPGQSYNPEDGEVPYTMSNLIPALTSAFQGMDFSGALGSFAF